MAESNSAKKRKAVTRDVETDAVNIPGDEFHSGSLDSVFSDSDAESYQSGSESEEQDEHDVEEQDEEGSDEEEGDEEDEYDLSDAEQDDIGKQIASLKSNKAGRNGNSSKDKEEEGLLPPIQDGSESPEPVLLRMDELETNYTVTTDANGNPRYIYKEIEPVYDSDDSDNRKYSFIIL